MAGLGRLVALPVQKVDHLTVDLVNLKVWLPIHLYLKASVFFLSHICYQQGLLLTRKLFLLNHLSFTFFTSSRKKNDMIT